MESYTLPARAKTLENYFLILRLPYCYNLASELA